MTDGGAAMTDERAFHPAFLAACSDMELVALQHDLRTFPDDKPYLDQVMRELGRRQRANDAPLLSERLKGETK